MITIIVLWTTLYLIAMDTDMTSCHVFETCTSNKTPTNCNKQYCGSLNYAEIEKLYRGIFFTEVEIIQRSKIKARRRQNRLNKWTSAQRKRHTNDVQQSETTVGNHSKTQQSKRSKSRLEMYKLIMTSKSKSYTDMMSVDMESEIYFKPEEEYQESLPGDGDACCATNVSYIANKTLTNIDGKIKTIVHMDTIQPPKYQLIPHGKCVDYGICKGDCFHEDTYLTLLVYDPDSQMSPPVAFDTFELPGYCSCKNTT